MPAAPRLNEARTLAQAAALAREAIRKDSYAVSMPGQPGLRLITTAGSRQYKSFWTRDASFAGFGILAEPGGDKTVHDVLSSLFDRANSKGQLPRRQGSESNAKIFLRAFLGMKVPGPRSLKSADYNGTLGVPQLDATALPIILAAAYVESTGDSTFLSRYYPAMRKSLNFLSRRAGADGLIRQKGGSDWKDMTHRQGRVAYTNALYYKAQESLAELARGMGDAGEAARDAAGAAKTKAAINSLLWDDHRGFYKDSDLFPGLSPDGNLLSVIFGVADRRQAGRILDNLQAMMRRSGLPLQALDGSYPKGSASIWTKMSGLEHYQDEDIWPWQGNLLAVAAAQEGRPDLAREALDRVAAQAVRDGTFREVYQPGAVRAPVETWDYHAEPDFLWSAGTYLWAYRLTENPGSSQHP
jgi:glycogen debranching enzyme